MKVLVTGGTGFVGRAVVRTLASRGHSVVLALRAQQQAPPFPSVVVGEIGPDSAWYSALQGVEAVVHLAARVHVMRSRRSDEHEYMRTNFEGTLNLAHAAAECGARRFIFVSTIKVNGELTRSRPFGPDDPPRAADAYARSKLAAEVGLKETKNLEPVIIRPPLVHGPGAKGNLARLCWLANSGIPVPFGGIDNRRDLVGVANLADLIERCIWHPAASGQTLLVSDGEPLSTPQLFRTIAESLGKPARLFRGPIRFLGHLARPFGLAGEVERLTQSLEVDISQTCERLQWSPPVGAVAGIAEMARAFAAGRS